MVVSFTSKEIVKYFQLTFFSLFSKNIASILKIFIYNCMHCVRILIPVCHLVFNCLHKLMDEKTHGLSKGGAERCLREADDNSGNNTHFAN